MLRVARTLLAGLLLLGLVVGIAPAASAATAPPAGGTTPVAAPAMSAAAAAAVSTTGGNAFDTCTTPSTTAMHAWLSSPYRSVGVYLGGESFPSSCSNANLTKSWVTAVTGQGWRLLPIYVGLQAPCTGCSVNVISTSGATAKAQGGRAATAAIARMSALGIPAATPVYLDVENYDTAEHPCTATCVAAVKAFTDGWTMALHAKGRVSGIYGSTSSMMKDLVSWRGTSYHEPDEIWYGHWDGRPLTTGDAAIPDTDWVGHRVHQFAGGHTESHGGVTLNVDSDVTSASVFTAVGPNRLYDSVTARVGTGNVVLTVAGKAGVPANATGVALNVEVIHPTAQANLVVAPYGSASTTGLQQFAKDQTISQTVIIPLHSGKIQVRLSAGKARVIVAVTGYLSATGGSLFAAVGPNRLYDSVTARVGTGNVVLTVAGKAGVPANATGVALNVEVIHPTAQANLVVAPYASKSTTGLQQFAKDQTISQTVIIPLHSGKIQVRLSAGKARVIVAVVGYLSATGGSLFAAVGPNRLYDSVTAKVGTGNVVLTVAGKAGVPANATGVALNVEVIHPTAQANLVVAPYASKSTTGLQQFAKDQTISQTVIIPLHSGKVQVRLSAGKARVIVAVVGYLR